MKVINYTAFKIIEDSIYKQKASKKGLKPTSISIKFKRYSIFFVNSRSVKSVRGGKQFSCIPFRKREKAVQKLNFAWIKFRGWLHLSVFRVDLIFFDKNRENREILSTQNFIHVRYIEPY